ncbi:DNA gyrase subunit A [Levilinea saccharolytica]|uniref:DNA gyrase subunit A n=2 Tax=Levilinea saccharolytica TaxID=229921 RepID=A0A0N0RDD6_9CHLR|nr:DNA gyrase subunit A [Levilinea saccharolytica]GAP19173.1 DNA gyrase subunit A [Levilinea saccharolytica]
MHALGQPGAAVESQKMSDAPESLYGKMTTVDIDSQMRSAYLDYAMSVIVSRALPDARDGLKPVHRRILFAMHELGIRANSAFKKSARIVGEVLGKYHPHGDMAVYDAMARMAQDFSMRYLLVNGQGNFGSIDGDSPAAMRYTEARLSAMAEELLADIDKNTIDFTENFDGTLQEPTVLPARLPNLLLNGSSGIAVGMATNIPPHNLTELVSALTYVIDNYDDLDDITVEDLARYLPGPDFPTGGTIVGREGINAAYSTGRGRLVMRGQAEIEENKGHFVIRITEIPYQVNKTTLIERIADLVREGRIDAISDLRDESDRKGMRIVIELRRGAEPHKVLNQLYKYTPLQSTFGVNMLALVNGEPRHLSLKRAIQIFLDHRQTVITRRTEFELAKARHRAHILDGLLIALANLDEVIEIIRRSPDADQARDRLMVRFSLTEIQAQAILDLQLRRLAALERQKIEDEQREIKARIAYLEELLADPKKILAVIREDLEELGKKYGDARRTRIAAEANEYFDEEDLVADQPILISITQLGYIKRVPPSAYRTRGRGGRGITGQNVKGEDEIIIMLHARTLHTILFFSDRGKVYSQRAYQIPEAGRTDRGTPMINLLPLSGSERITAAVAVPGFDAAAYCTMATERGRVKRVSLAEFANVRPSGLIAINLEEGDSLGWVRLTSGEDDVLMVTAFGQALRITENQIRPMGRQAAGVTGLRLRAQDHVAAVEVVEPGGYLLVVTENGFGKRTPLEDYPTKGRATGGVTTIDQKSLKTIGKIATARVVQEVDEITAITSAGMVLRLKVSSIRPSGRSTRGVHLINVAEGDAVASLARMAPEETPEA